MLTHCSKMKTLINTVMSLYFSTTLNIFGLDSLTGKLANLKKKYKDSKTKITKAYKEIDTGFKEAKKDVDNIKDKTKNINQKINKKNHNNINNADEDTDNTLSDLLNNENDTEANEDDNNFINDIFNDSNIITNNKTDRQNIIISSENILTQKESFNKSIIILFILQFLIILTTIILIFVFRKNHTRTIKILIYIFGILMFVVNDIMLLISNNFASYTKLIILKDILTITNTLLVGFFIGKSTYGIIIENTDLP